MECPNSAPQVHPRQALGHQAPGQAGPGAAGSLHSSPGSSNQWLSALESSELKRKKKESFMINIAAGIITVITTIITVWIGACHGSFGEEKVTACSWENG